MGSINKVILIGNIGRKDPMTTFSNGGMILNMRVATSENWKDKTTGEKKEATEWHNIVVTGGLAEVVDKYTDKGSQLYIEGQLRTRKWLDKEGNEKYTSEIVVNPMANGVVQFLDNKKKEDIPF